MRTTDTDEILARLRAMSGVGFFEVYHRTTFQCYRHRKTGGVQTVTVHLDDAGPSGSPRYHVSAEADDGATASGNSDDSLDATLAIVHWDDLDRTE